MSKSTTNQTISRAALLEELSNEKPARSVWDRGVQAAAYDIVEELDGLDDLPVGYNELTAALLNGASDWDAYSWGGCALIYDEQIAERYCTPSELKRTRNGERRPNGREEWLDVQARALRQACSRIRHAARELANA